MKEIESMLNNAAQRYYGGKYIEYQRKVIESNNKFFPDYEMACQFISSTEESGNLVDIGSGNCRWFNLFENKVKNYFAVEVNKTALSLAPKSLKLIPINKNIFDEEFDFMSFVKTEIDSAFFGFFLSHFSDLSIKILLNKLKSINCLIIVDSFWGSKHKKKYISKDLGDIERRFSATEKILIPKRFFDYSDIDNLVRPFGYSVIKFIKRNYWFACMAKK